jgi:tRNA A-37 threonylcarbamoyl transferase component Bud32
MATVYRGEHQLLRKKVAIKVLKADIAIDAQMSARFETEAVAAARLDHPNCVGISDFGRTGRGQYYLVMELIEGEPVSELLRGNQRLQWTRAVPIVRQVLRGLSRAHELGIVHRDLKPANIMLTSKAGAGELVKIIDFGIAKLFGDAAQIAPQLETSADIVFGTADYMPPERLRGDRKVDERSDLYAVGVSLYEMVVGRRPFVAVEAYAVARMALTETPELPSKVVPEAGIPAALEVAIMRALEKLPEKRFRSARDFLAALEAPDLAMAAPDLPRMATTAIAPRAQTDPVAVVPRPDGGPGGRKPWLWVVAAAGAVILALVIATCGKHPRVPVLPEAKAGEGPGPAQLAALVQAARDPASVELRQSAADRLIALGHEDLVPVDKARLDLAQGKRCEDRLAALERLAKAADPAAIPAINQAIARPDNECLQARARQVVASLEPARPDEPIIEAPEAKKPRRSGADKKSAPTHAPAGSDHSGGGHF